MNFIPKNKSQFRVFGSGSSKRRYHFKGSTTQSVKTALRRENLRYRPLISARSIEETGLDSFSYGDGFSYYPTHATGLAPQEACSTAPKFNSKTMTTTDAYFARQGAYRDGHFAHRQNLVPDYEEKRNFITGIALMEDSGAKDDPFDNGQMWNEKGTVRRTNSKNGRLGNFKKLQEDGIRFGDSAVMAKSSVTTVLPIYGKYIENNNTLPSNNKKIKAKRLLSHSYMQDKNTERKLDNHSNESGENVMCNKHDSTAEEQYERQQCSLITKEADSVTFSSISSNHNNTTEYDKLMRTSMDQVLNDTFPSCSRTISEQSDLVSTVRISSSGTHTKDSIDGLPTQKFDVSSLESSLASSHNDIVADSSLLDDTEKLVTEGKTDTVSDGLDANATQACNSVTDAQKRWRRLKHTMTVVNRMTASKSSNYDLLEEEAVGGNQKCSLYAKGDAGSMGAAAFEGVRTTARSRRKGRKGMEGLLVRQDKGFIAFIQDFYVTCLKLPITHFLIGVFLVPVALGLLFTPLYLLDIDGLSFDGVTDENLHDSPISSTKHRCSALLNVFLYALSLSTTFGGSPVAAVSPFCLLVANMNTLMAQFLFVFLSGAVFARMSQPSQPIRCAKKAIIKTDDVTVNPGEYSEEKFKVFAVRLVLGGPTPCELVDAKICLTFRIFVTLPNGSIFCSTQDLDIVRSEVSYLRYGLMVRHIIDRKSPVYGHTLESLDEGDASFSLTIMGMERSSMQSIFHLEDYFVSDGDVMWDGDYIDFIHVNQKGQRVLDHSKIDLLKPNKPTSTDTKSGVETDSMKTKPEQK